MSLRTPKLDLPYIAPSQAQKHITHNEAIRALDALVQLSVSAVSDSPTETPADGQRYIVSDNPMGVFEGHAQKVASFQDGAWRFFNPQMGWQAYDQMQDSLLVFTDQGWQAQINDQPPEFTPRLGVNGTADEVNRLLVRSEASLMDNVGGGHQLKVNKTGEADTASLLFQSGYQGHAELGLTGSNDFALRVSSDGGAFKDAMRANRDNGDVFFPNGIDRDMLLSTISLAGDDDEFIGFPNLSTIATVQASFTLTADRIYFNAVYVDRPTEFTGGLVAVRAIGDNSDAVMRLGIFDIGAADGNNWSVGARRVDFGTKALTETGPLEFSLENPIILPRGWYMFALAVNVPSVEIRYIQNYTPGLCQFFAFGTGSATNFRIGGPSAYVYISNQKNAIENGFPENWNGDVAIDLTPTTFRNYMWFLPKFKHWNTPE